MGLQAKKRETRYLWHLCMERHSCLIFLLVLPTGLLIMSIWHAFMSVCCVNVLNAHAVFSICRVNMLKSFYVPSARSANHLQRHFVLSNGSVIMFKSLIILSVLSSILSK